MDIGAMERIRPMMQVGARSGDVAPTLGVEGAGRMEEDSYRSANEEQNRGMDEQTEDDDQQESEASSEEGQSRSVSLFA